MSITDSIKNMAVKSGLFEEDPQPTQDNLPPIIPVRKLPVVDSREVSEEPDTTTALTQRVLGGTTPDVYVWGRGESSGRSSSWGRCTLP